MYGALATTRGAPARILKLGVIAVALAAASCSNEAVFTTRYASDFTPGRHVASVLGVYRDGRMSSDAWGTIGARISRSLGSTECKVAYAEPLVSENGALWSAIDDYARNNGPTDDLLAQLAPAAQGDLVMVLTLAGRVRTRSEDKGEGLSPPSSQPSAMGGRGGGMGAGQGRAPPPGRSGRREPADTNALDLSASLFSVAQGRSVALVAMEYSGVSADEAIALFASKLAQALPGTSCAGWIWGDKVDAGRIRAMADQ